MSVDPECDSHGHVILNPVGHDSHFWNKGRRDLTRMLDAIERLSPNEQLYTRNAQAIAKSWRKAVHDLNPDRFLIEALVDPELDQKIDVLDQETHCAYEFKVSGKNAQSEFYKDVVKVIVWNDRRKNKITRLV